MGNTIRAACNERRPMWWQCCYHVADENKYIIGGYLTNDQGVTECWMGEEFFGSTMGEAYLAGIESAVQFLLEDMNMRIEDIALVSHRKDIVDWTDKLYRVPAVTGSNLLSPGPQALVPVVTVANHVR
ncbi:hypothetical protein PIB30_042625 [Stylosanthes scabra]|uniref:Uncharacterized protein n=1 Tax=Stylosanthes scabra TaxID=79078 RepID=A0ABU6YCM7_9FABA|nr:hypothetical protein [Stylosanthes scabra]